MMLKSIILIYHIFVLQLMHNGVRIDIWTHFMRGCIIDYVH